MMSERTQRALRIAAAVFVAAAWGVLPLAGAALGWNLEHPAPFTDLHP